MASFDTTKLVENIKAGKITSKEPPKYIFEKNPRNNRKTKKLNPRWTAWSNSQKKKQIKKDVDKYVADRKRPINKDLTIDNSKKNKDKPKNKTTKNGGTTKKTYVDPDAADKKAEKVFRNSSSVENAKEKHAKKDSLKIKKGSARNFIKYKGKMVRRGTPMAKRAEERERKRKALGAKGYMKR